VRNPQEELDQLLISHSIKKFQKRFLAANGIVISFTNGALELLKQLSLEKGQDLEQVCSDLLHDYEYGLRLLGCDHFTIDEEIVNNPKTRLEQLIKKAYEKK